MIKKYIKLSVDKNPQVPCYYNNKGYLAKKILAGVENPFDILKKKKYLKLFMKYFNLGKYEAPLKDEKYHEVFSHIKPAPHKEDLEFYDFLKDKNYVTYEPKLEKKIYDVVIVNIKDLDKFMSIASDYASHLTHIIVIGYNCTSLNFEKFIKCVEHVKYIYENSNDKCSCGSIVPYKRLRFIKNMCKKNVLNKYINLNQLI